MYMNFFGLREHPFELGTDLRFLFLPESHQEALSNLQYGISSRKGVTVLTGEVGTGKTTVIRAAIAHAGERFLGLHMSNPRLTRGEFFEFLAAGFDLGPGAGASKVACLEALQAVLIARLERNDPTALIVDEAQSVSDELLEEIRLLTNLETTSGRLFPVILVGQPEFADRLNAPAMRHLKQRVSLRCALRALTLHETAAYIVLRIRIAGGNAAAVFTREAVQLIHEVSSGIPRTISVLCENALLTGYAANERPIGTRLLADVCKDLDVECPEQSAIGKFAVRPAVPSPDPAHTQLLQERRALFGSFRRHGIGTSEVSRS